MLDNFLKETELSFEEYSEWFSSLKKGDEVLRYPIIPTIVEEVSSIGVRLAACVGLYHLRRKGILYFESPRKYYQAAHFPIPSKEQIELIKQKRQAKLQLEVGEVYEDGNGIEWTVEVTDLPSEIFSAFTCRCFRKNGMLLQYRLYTRDGKNLYKPSRMNLISKKGIVKMPIERMIARPLVIGQVWQMSNDQEMTVVAQDVSDNTFLLVNDIEAHWFYADGTKFVGFGEKDLHAVKYLRETDRPRLELGEKYYDEDGNIVGIKGEDSHDFVGTNNILYYQFGFAQKLGDKDLVKLVEDISDTSRPALLSAGEHPETCSEKEELDISSEIAQLFESCQKKAREFAKACDDEKYRLAAENDALKLTIEQLRKQLKDLETRYQDRENRVSFLCAHHVDICNLKDEIEEENSKLAEENKQLKQKLDQLKSFLEPDHK